MNFVLNRKEEAYMGIESFYIKIESERLRNRVNLLEKYNKYLDYSIEQEYCYISGALVSFLPAVKLIYNIFDEVKKGSFSVMSMDREVDFNNFDTFSDFLNWMYEIWKEKLDYFNKEYGAFIIPPSLYYKTRRKFVKKYYKKIDEKV